MIYIDMKDTNEKLFNIIEKVATMKQYSTQEMINLCISKCAKLYDEISHPKGLSKQSKFHKILSSSNPKLPSYKY